MLFVLLWTFLTASVAPTVIETGADKITEQVFGLAPSLVTEQVTPVTSAVALRSWKVFVLLVPPAPVTHAMPTTLIAEYASSGASAVASVALPLVPHAVPPKDISVPDDAGRMGPA